jgi:hypothetical protein
MNWYVWSKPPLGDVNNIEKLGNPGWNWEDYFHYSRLRDLSVNDLSPLTHLNSS